MDSPINRPNITNITTNETAHSQSILSGLESTYCIKYNFGKKLAVRVQMLDGSISMFQVQAKAVGKILFDQVCRQLHLLEADYFGLEYEEQSTNSKYWLDLRKPLNRQTGLLLTEPLLRFCVKFYTPNPAQLEEEYTRYLFCLQIKRDLATGSFQCNNNTAALMASFIVQASCGDFVPEDYPDHTYLTSHRFVPHQDSVMQTKIMENHKKHSGQTPAEADMNLLETARRCEHYGMKMHAAKDIEGVTLSLAVAHMGIAVFQGITRINIFSWAKIRKISFKRKRFLIKLHAESSGYYKDTVEFSFDRRNDCKSFWKKCVETHGFFRCVSIENHNQRKTSVLSRGSQFRYSGKTQKQIIEFVRENYVKRQHFERSLSFRQGPLNESIRSQSQPYVNSSYSAGCLPPIGIDRDKRNPRNTSILHFSTRLVDIWNHPKYFSEKRLSQVTAALVEMYQKESCVQQLPHVERDFNLHSTQNISQLSVHKGSPSLPDLQLNKPQIYKKFKITKNQVQQQVLLSSVNLGQNQSSPLEQNSNSLAISIKSQAGVMEIMERSREKMNTNDFKQRRVNLVAHNKLLKTERKETVSLKIATSMDLTTQTTSQENIVSALNFSPQSTPVHYSSINFSTSKKSLLQNDSSFNTQINTVNNSSINNASHNELLKINANGEDYKKSNKNQFDLTTNCDLYAKIDRKSKKVHHRSYEFLDKLPKKSKVLTKNSSAQSFTTTLPNYLSNLCKIDNRFLRQNKKSESTYSSTKFDSSDLNENFNASQYNDMNLVNDNTDQQLYSCRNNSLISTKSELSLTCSMESLKTSFNAVETQEIPEQNNNVNISKSSYKAKIYKNIDVTELNINETKSKSETEEFSNLSMCPVPFLEDKYYFHNDFYRKKESWMKSSSCRDLLSEKENPHRMLISNKKLISFNLIDTAVTLSHDSCQSIYFGVDQSINSRNFIRSSKIFSSSFPGSIRNNFWDCKLKQRNAMNYSGSQEELTHDSYELSERKYEIFNKNISFSSSDGIRSSSFDSGNFVLSDDEILAINQKYHSDMDVPSKTAADAMYDIWGLDDPRYLPREKMSVKSDGNFYRKILESQGSQNFNSGSLSDNSETKFSGSSCFSKKSRDSLYHTDSKKSYNSTKSRMSLISSSASKESLIHDFFYRKYEMPMTTGDEFKLTKNNKEVQRKCSVGCKSDNSNDEEYSNNDILSELKKVNSIGCLCTHPNSFNARLGGNASVHNSNEGASSSNVLSEKSQNMDTKNIAHFIETNSSRNNCFDICREGKEVQPSLPSSENSYQHIGNEYHQSSVFKKKNDSENIFSFECDKIDSLTFCLESSEEPQTDEIIKENCQFPLSPELLSEFDKQTQSFSTITTRKEELIAKTHFEEYNPKESVLNNEGLPLPNLLGSLSHKHGTVERTKSDPNSLAKRSRFCKNQRRNVLVHQKSIDLTPFDSSDEDYLYKKIPSAPPLCKTFGNFEILQNYDTPITETDETKNGFEIKKRITNELEHEAKELFKAEFKDDIPYILHKRLVSGNGNIHVKQNSPKSVISSRTPNTSHEDIICGYENKPRKESEDFLLTQNIDVVDYGMPAISESEKLKKKIELIHPNRRTSKKNDRKIKVNPNKNLTWVEEDLENTQEDKICKNRFFEVERSEKTLASEEKMFTSHKGFASKKCFSRTRGINKVQNIKTRITSFSSDDESLDSDDVFGSTELVPLALEFSPPQSRKEIEPILKIEQNKLLSATLCRGQTMSSTEIEGSPPQCRRLAELENRYFSLRNDSVCHVDSELRRISERSISISSSEEESLVAYESICVGVLSSLDSAVTNQKNAKIKTQNAEPFCVENSKPRNKSQERKKYKRDFLNLSEGSGLAFLGKEKFSFEKCIRQRRTQSLEISLLHTLALNDRLADRHDSQRFEEQTLQKELKLTQSLDDCTPDKNCSIPSTEICPSSIQKNTALTTVFIDSEEINLLNQLAFIEKIALKGVKVKDRTKSTMELKDGNHLILDILKYNFDCSPLSSCNSSMKTTPGVSRANSLEGVRQNKLNTKAKNSESTKSKQNIGPIFKAKRGKKHSNDGTRLFESKKRFSKEGDETHEETLADIMKRKERQQKLYESAVKQTITMLSPMPEDNISANAAVDNISVQNTVDGRASNVVLIADSPPNLDTSSLVKYSRSFDEGNQQQKLQKANRSFEDRNKSYEDSEKSDTTSDVPVESSDPSIKCQTFEEVHGYEKGTGCLKNKHTSAARNKLEADKIYGKKNSCAENRVIPEQVPFKVCDLDIYKVFALQNNSNDGIDTQAVISERRLLEILKRQSHRFEYMTGDSTESYVSVDDSTSESKSSLAVKDFQQYKDCLEPTINEDTSYQRNSNEIKVSDLVKTSTTSLDHTLIKKPSSLLAVEYNACSGSEASESIPIAEKESLIPKSIIDDLPEFQPSIQLLFINRKDELEKKLFQDNNKSKCCDSLTICAAPSSNKLSNSVEFEKEGTSVDEESSISCSIAGPLGISYNNEDPEDQKWLDLKRTLEEYLKKKTIAVKPTDREHSLTKKIAMPVLEKQASIDFGIRTELKNNQKEEAPTENVLESENEQNKCQNSYLYQEFLEKTPRDAKPLFESQGSNGTESNSSSLEIAICQEGISEPIWTSFTTQIPEKLSSEDSFVVVDNESSDAAPSIKNSFYCDSKGMNFTSKKSKSVDEPSDFTIPVSNPLSRNTLYGIESDSVDNLGYSAVFPAGRTLSRISERSTASEKSSIEDDVSKLSTHSLSMQDESAALMDQQLSMSSSSHSNSNIAYLSDADRRTSAEMPEIPCDSSITGERLPNGVLHHAKSMTIVTGRFAVTQVKEDISEECNRTKISLISNNGSQDSEDWPLPEIPYDFIKEKSTELLNLNPNIDKLSRNILCWNPSTSFPSQVTKNLFQSPLYKEEHEAMKFDINKASSDKTICMGCNDKNSLATSIQDSRMQIKSDNCPSLVENNPMIKTDCLGSLPFLQYSDGCCLSYKQDNIKPEKNETWSDSVIVFQPTRMGQDTTFVSSEEILSETENKVISSVENRNKLCSHKKTNEYVNSDTQKQSELLHDDPKSIHLHPYRKYSHSSHSEEETSSFASDIDETVRFGLQFNKCTHSSHSEDTSMCLSISEWSTGTTTIHQYANLSGSDSISAVSNHSLGIKSEKSNNTKSSVSSFNKSSESLNAKSSKFILHSSLDGVQYDMLSNSDTDKHSDSVTRSDETDTGSGAQSYNQFPSNKTQVEEDNNCLALKTNQNVDTVKNSKDNQCLLALVHKNTFNPDGNSVDICTARREHDVNSTQNDFTYDSVVNKSTSVETTEAWYQNRCNQPNSELFNEYLYRNNKIFPLKKPPTKPQHYSSSSNTQNEDNRLSFNSQSTSFTSTNHSESSTTGL